MTTPRDEKKCEVCGKGFGFNEDIYGKTGHERHESCLFAQPTDTVEKKDYSHTHCFQSGVDHSLHLRCCICYKEAELAKMPPHTEKKQQIEDWPEGMAAEPRLVTEKIDTEDGWDGDFEEMARAMGIWPANIAILKSFLKREIEEAYARGVKKASGLSQTIINNWLEKNDLFEAGRAKEREELRGWAKKKLNPGDSVARDAIVLVSDILSHLSTNKDV